MKKNSIRFAQLTIALAICAAWPATVRANPIDMELKQIAPKILEHCQEQGWKNVGVLNFRVQVGKKKESRQAGQLNTLMAIRLENALIVANDLNAPIGVTRNAGEQAIKQFKDIGYLKEDERKKLLQGEYPLAWGKTKVKVDAFLTGKVHLSPDYKKTTITLQVFDQKNPKLRPLKLGKEKTASFTVATDLTTLADMNQEFVVPRDATLRPDDLDISLLKKDSFEKYLDFKIYYGDKAVKMDQKGDMYHVRTPKPDEKVYFSLKAKDEPLAVVVLVNGVNTFLEEPRMELNQYSKWVLQDLKQTYEIHGFHTDTKKVVPFQVIPPAEAHYYPLADSTQVGRIELHIFGKAKEKVVATETVPSLRPEIGKPETLLEAKKKLLMAVPPVKKGIIVPSNNPKESKVNLVDFDNIVHIGSFTISYYEPNAKKE